MAGKNPRDPVIRIKLKPEVKKELDRINNKQTEEVKNRPVYDFRNPTLVLPEGEENVLDVRPEFGTVVTKLPFEKYPGSRGEQNYEEYSLGSLINESEQDIINKKADYQDYVTKMKERGVNPSYSEEEYIELVYNRKEPETEAIKQYREIEGENQLYGAPGSLERLGNFATGRMSLNPTTEAIKDATLGSVMSRGIESVYDLGRKFTGGEVAIKPERKVIYNPDNFIESTLIPGVSGGVITVSMLGGMNQALVKSFPVLAQMPELLNGLSFTLVSTPEYSSRLSSGEDPISVIKDAANSFSTGALLGANPFKRFVPREIYGAVIPSVPHTIQKTTEGRFDPKELAGEITVNALLTLMNSYNIPLEAAKRYAKDLINGKGENVPVEVKELPKVKQYLNDHADVINRASRRQSVEVPGSKIDMNAFPTSREELRKELHQLGYRNKDIAKMNYDNKLYYLSGGRTGTPLENVPVNYNSTPTAEEFTQRREDAKVEGFKEPVVNIDKTAKKNLGELDLEGTIKRVQELQGKQQSSPGSNEPPPSRTIGAKGEYVDPETLKTGEKIRSDFVKNGDEVLEVLPQQKYPNMLSVRMSDGNVTLIGKKGLKPVEPPPTPHLQRNAPALPEGEGRIQKPAEYISPKEKETFDYLGNNIDKLKEEYNKKYGNVINQDNAKELFSSLGYDRLKPTKDFSRAPWEVVNKLFDEKMSKGDVKSAVIMAGGPGSGKTTFAEGLNKQGKYDLILDTNIEDFEATGKRIDRLIEKGVTPDVVFIYRDPVDALKGIFDRTAEGKHLVTMDIQVRGYLKSLENMKKLYDKYGDKINYRVYDTKEGTDISLEEFKPKQYTQKELKGALENEAQRLRDEGKITEQLYKGYKVGGAEPNIQGIDKGITGADKTKEEGTGDTGETTRLVTDDKLQKALQNIKGRKGKFGAQSSLIGGFNPENLPDYVTIGLYHLETLYRTTKKKVIDFKEWSAEFLKSFEKADEVKPHLRAIWREMNKEWELQLKIKTSNEIASPEARNDTKGEEPKLNPEFKSSIENKAAELRKSGKSLQEIRDELGFDFAFEEHPVSGELKASLLEDTPPPYPSPKERGVNRGGKSSEVWEMEKRWKDIRRERDKVPRSSQEYKDMTASMDAIKLKIKTMKEVRGKKSELEELTLPKNTKEIVPYFIRKLADYTGEVNKEGYYGHDAAEEIRRMIRKDLYNNTEFQKLSTEKKNKVVERIEKTFNELNRERMGIEIGLDEQFREPKLREFFNKGIRQSKKVVDKMGEGGKEFKNRLDQMTDKERELMGEPSGLIFKISELSKEEYNNLTKIRNGMMYFQNDVIQPLNDNVAKINKEINDYYRSMAKEFEKRGFETFNPATGEKYLFNPRDNYEPRILDTKIDKLGVVRNKDGEPVYDQLRTRILEHMVETKQARNVHEANEILQKYLAQKNTRIGKFGNVEFARVLEFPDDMYEKDPVKRLIKYSSKTSHRLAHADAFGIKGEIASDLLTKIKGEHYDYNFARDLYRYEIGDLTDQERHALETVNIIKGFQAVTKFSPFTTLRNSFQGFLGSMTRGNLKSAVQGFLRSYQRDIKLNAYQSGALADTIESFIMKEFGGDKELVGEYLRWIGFTGTDRFNRVISSAAGEVFYKDMLNRIKNDSMLKKRALREFEKMGLNTEEIVKRGEFTEEELNLIRRTFAGDAQFNIRPGDLPLFWSSPLGKLVTQWKPFGYKMTQLINEGVVKELKHGNIFPALTFLAGYSIAGEGVNMIIDFVRSFMGFSSYKKSEDESVWEKTAYMKLKKGETDKFALRLFSDLAGLGAMSLMVDVFRSMGYGKSAAVDNTMGVVGAFLGPTVSTGVGIVSDIAGPIAWKLFSNEGEWDKTFVRSLRGLYRTVIANIPGGSIPRTFGLTRKLENIIFGENISAKEEKYHELKERGVDVNKLREIDDAEKEMNDLREKALETQKQEDIKAYQEQQKKIYYMKRDAPEYRELEKLNYEENKKRQQILHSPQ